MARLRGCCAATEDAGAGSSQSVASGTAAFRYTVDETGRFRFVGLAHTAGWQTAAGMDFSFRMQAGHADVYENGVWQADVLVNVGDVLEIDIANGTATYYRNGAPQYTSTKAPTYPLFVSTDMIDAGSTIAQAMIGGAAGTGGTAGGTGGGTGDFGCGVGVPCGHGLWPAASWRPYATTSAFNLQVQSTYRTLSNSAAIVNRILGDIAADKQVANILTPVDHHGG